MGVLRNFVDNIARAGLATLNATVAGLNTVYASIASVSAVSATVAGLNTVYASIASVSAVSATVAGLNTVYAALAGLATQVFSVGTATAAAHAVRFDQTALSCAFSCFLPSSIANITGSGGIIKIDGMTEIFDLGGNYNTDTARFTAPKTGKYRLSFLITTDGQQVGSHTVAAYLATSNRTYVDTDGLATGVNKCFKLSELTDMDAGDTAEIRIQGSRGTMTVGVIGAALIYTAFSGELVA